MQAPAGGTRILTMKKPVGPCLFVTPWNFPLAMGTRKIGPAVAAGCTMVLKPAAQTPLTHARARRDHDRGGAAGGVLNVVPTTRDAELSATLQADDRLRKVSFTGSTAVGRDPGRAVGAGLQRVSMELGGNAPFLVFDDADLDAAVDGAMVAKMRNMGEACTSANRFLVHVDVAEEFAAQAGRPDGRADASAAARTTGVDVGPLIDADAVESVTSLVDRRRRGRRRGSLVGGSAREGAGHFFTPTVLLDVAPSSAINREEIFGPVAPITTFETEQDAVARANDTEYGLAPTSTPGTWPARSGWPRSWTTAWSASTRG